MKRKKSIHIFRKLKKTGVEIKIKKKKYLIDYPSYVWEKLPKSLHRVFADSLAYISTWHLPLVYKEPVVYHFPHPPIESVFFINDIFFLVVLQLLFRFVQFFLRKPWPSLLIFRLASFSTQWLFLVNNPFCF
ncbi:MAG: hypothetical protein ACK4FL_03010 [Microgenomates group bacterium]